jgi:hypothetical protein
VGEEHSAGAAALVDGLLRPWFEQSVYDEAVLARLWHTGEGRPEPPEPPAPGRPPLTAVSAAARGDAVVRRGLARVLMTLDTPALVLDDEAFRTRVRAAAGTAGPAAAPTRDELLDAATAAASAASTTAPTTAPTAESTGSRP